MSLCEGNGEVETLADGKGENGSGQTRSRHGIRVGAVTVSRTLRTSYDGGLLADEEIDRDKWRPEIALQ